MTKANNGQDGGRTVGRAGDTHDRDDEDDSSPAHPDSDQETTDAADATDAADERAATLAAFDLDGDGTVSNTEAVRANLGVIDARLQSLAERGGILGRLAAATHRVLDRFDND